MYCKKDSMSLTVLALFFSGLIVSSSAIAGTRHSIPFSFQHEITDSNSQIGISILDTQSNYSEDIQGNTGSDVENGMIPGFKISASENFNLFNVNNLYASLSYRNESGTVQYEQGSSYTTSQHAGDVINAKLGKTFFINSRVAITPYIFGGYRWWNRNIPNGTASPENYHNGYVGLGGMLQYAATKRVVLSVNGGFGEVIGAGVTGTLDPSLTDYYRGLPSHIRFNLASRPYYTCGLGAIIKLTKI